MAEWYLKDDLELSARNLLQTLSQNFLQRWGFITPFVDKNFKTNDSFRNCQISVFVVIITFL